MLPRARSYQRLQAEGGSFITGRYSAERLTHNTETSTHNERQNTNSTNHSSNEPSRANRASPETANSTRDRSSGGHYWRIVARLRGARGGGRSPLLSTMERRNPLRGSNPTRSTRGNRSSALAHNVHHAKPGSVNRSGLCFVLISAQLSSGARS